MILGRHHLHPLSRLAAGAILAAAALAALPAPASAHAHRAEGSTGCAAHGAHRASAASGHHTPHADGTTVLRGPAVAPGAEGGCAHCADTACEFLSPCSGSSAALTATGAAGRPAPHALGRPRTASLSFRSRTEQPPTPPPHSLLS